MAIDGPTEDVLAAVGRRTEQALAAPPRQLDSVAALRRWRDALVAAQRVTAQRAGDLVDVPGDGLARWEAALVAGITAMRERGELVRHADPAGLATAVLAAVQGGLLMAWTTRSTRPLELALDMAIDHVQAHVW